MFFKDSPLVQRLKEIRSLSWDLFNDVSILRLKLSEPVPQNFLEKYKIKKDAPSLTPQQFQDLRIFRIIEFERWRENIQPQVDKLLPMVNRLKLSTDLSQETLSNLLRDAEMFSLTILYSGDWYLHNVKKTKWIALTPENSSAVSKLLDDLELYVKEIFIECAKEVKRLQGQKKPKVRNINEITDKQRAEIKRMRRIASLTQELFDLSEQIVPLQKEFKTLLFPVIRILRKAKFNTESGRSKMAAAIQILREKLKIMLGIVETAENFAVDLKSLRSNEDWELIIEFSKLAHRDGMELESALNEIYYQLNDQTYIKNPNVIEKDKTYINNEADNVWDWYQNFNDYVNETLDYIDQLEREY